MESYSTIKPSFTIPIHTAVFEDVKTFRNASINRTLLQNSINSTSNVIVSSSTVIIRGNDNSSNSGSSGDVDMLFTWVFIACVGLALLLVVSLFMVIVCWKIRRKRRTATVTDVKKGAGKERKRGRVNLRNSIKRVFVAEGPLYAVSNLSGSRYTGIPEGQNQANSESARSSPVIPPDNPSNISKDNQHIVYQRYLSPIEGVPPPPSAASTSSVDRGDETYLQPIDELRASKRFLQHSRNEIQEPDETYLEPLHGIPVPDDIHQKTSTPTTSFKPIKSPKPSVKPKP